MFFLQELHLLRINARFFPNINAILSLFFPINASMHVLPYYCQISQGRKFDQRSARIIRRPALQNFVPI